MNWYKKGNNKMIKTILFDLDGTLLPMEQEAFVEDYARRLALTMAAYGYEPRVFGKALWKSVGYVIQNDGSMRNDERFWNIFAGELGEGIRDLEHVFLHFYETEFQKVAKSCGFNPEAKDVIELLKGMGFRLILATNPLFPPIATESRVRWAGLEPSDFEYITTYDNSRYCKPNPLYYQEIMEKLGLQPQECLMVGNDVVEDMMTEKLGMKVFLLKDCLINKNNEDITRYPQGSFSELKEFVKNVYVDR